MEKITDHQPVENVNLPAAVDDGRLNQLRGEAGVHILLIEEHGKAVGNGGDNQGKVAVHQVHGLDFLVEADDADLPRQHHKHQHHPEQEAPEPELEFGEGVGGHYGEIGLHQGDAHR